MMSAISEILVLTVLVYTFALHFKYTTCHNDYDFKTAVSIHKPISIWIGTWLWSFEVQNLPANACINCWWFHGKQYFCLRSLIWIIRPDFLEQTCSLWNLGSLKNNWNTMLVWIFYVFFVHLKLSSAPFWLFSKARAHFHVGKSFHWHLRICINAEEAYNRFFWD